MKNTLFMISGWQKKSFLSLLVLLVALSGLALPAVLKSENVVPDNNCPDTLCMVEVSNSMPKTFRSTRPNLITRGELLRPVFDTLRQHSRPLRVLQVGDSHVKGGSFPNAVKLCLQTAWGEAAQDSLGTGVWFTSIGRNGATITHFATEEYMQQFSALQPDLIILSFGTNECHGRRYSETVHAGQMEAFYSMLSQACPRSVVLLTTPPGDYLSYRTGSKNRRRTVRTVNPNTVKCAAEIERFGAAHDLPVWDLNSITGGILATRNWISINMMRPDRVHFQPEGYRTQGNLLGEALLKAYNDYVAG